MNQYVYLYDTLGRPTNRNAHAFAYDRRGQLARATLDSTTNSYAYDYAGNRTTSSDSLWGPTTWDANALNQYSSGANISFTFDLDGNLTASSDGFSFSWDAHNRLTSVTKDNTTCTYTYDYRHRRTSSIITTPTSTTRHTFSYDNWSLIHEHVETYNPTTETWTPIRSLEYFWGPDLSGTLQGAGGIGGLLAVSIDNIFYFPCTDNLGNITAYVSETGTTVATYSYDAFGNTLASSGTHSILFPHRFSSKYFDSDTDLYYYGYRFYAPQYGRWLNRDPIEEEGGGNLYAFINNSPSISFDFLGLFSIYIHTDGFGHVGIFDKNNTSYDYGRYNGVYSGIGSIGPGPNTLQTTENWSARKHPVTHSVYSFSVCPNLEDKIQASLKKKYEAGSKTLPDDVKDRYYKKSSIPDLNENERYMGSDWTINDNCMTFTFSAIVGAVAMVRNDLHASDTEKKQADVLYKLAYKVCFVYTPSHVKSLLDGAANEYDWISVKTVEGVPNETNP